MKTKIITIIAVIALNTNSFAQTPPQQVISSGGDTHKNENISISYTIGETIIDTYKTSDIILTQGFHQGTLTIVSIEEINEIQHEIIAYPNPASDHIYLKVDHKDFYNSNYSYQLYNLNGKLIQSGGIESSKTRISFTNLTTGTYIIKVFDGKQEAKSIKVIKQ